MLRTDILTESSGFGTLEPTTYSWSWPATRFGRVPLGPRWALVWSYPEADESLPIPTATAPQLRRVYLASSDPSPWLATHTPLVEWQGPDLTALSGTRWARGQVWLEYQLTPEEVERLWAASESVLEVIGHSAVGALLYVSLQVRNPSSDPVGPAERVITQAAGVGEGGRTGWVRVGARLRPGVQGDLPALGPARAVVLRLILLDASAGIGGTVRWAAPALYRWESRVRAAASAPVVVGGGGGGGGGVEFPEYAAIAFVSRVSGNDTTGLVNRADAPFATIAAAISAVAQAGGGMVQLEPGVYVLGQGAPVGQPALTIPPGVVVRGAGKDVTVLRTYSRGVQPYWAFPETWVSYRGFGVYILAPEEGDTRNTGLMDCTLEDGVTETLEGYDGLTVGIGIGGRSAPSDPDPGYYATARLTPIYIRNVRVRGYWVAMMTTGWVGS